MRIVTDSINGETPRKVIQFQFDGKRFAALDGDSIAAALLANGVRTLRYSEKQGEPRGIYCGIGHCYECRVYLNGVGNVRTCITPVEEEMSLWSRRGYNE